MYTLTDLIPLLKNGFFYAFVLKNQDHKTIVDTRDIDLALETIELYKNKSIVIECYKKNGTSRKLSNVYTLKTPLPTMDIPQNTQGAEQFIIATLNKENTKLESQNEKLIDKLEALQEKYKQAEKELAFKDEKHAIELSKIESSNNSGLSGLGNKVANVVEANPEIILGLIDRFFPQKEEKTLSLGNSDIWGNESTQNNELLQSCTLFLQTANEQDINSLKILIEHCTNNAGLISALLNRYSQQQKATA